MKRMVPRISAALLLLVAVSTAGSEEKLSVREMLSIAKVSGACGIVFQMREFQESTQLEGGQAFVVRFLMAEAARLGQTPQEYIKGCNNATDTYKKLWELFPETK